jgi:uncharacterized protein DUF1579
MTSQPTASPRFDRLAGVSLLSLLMLLLTHVTATAQPGPSKEHEIFKNDVGTWDATMKLFGVPGAEPTVSKCTETNELVGGMWLVSRFEGELMGMPFTGIGTWGYDPAEKKYVGTWIDNMSPYPQVLRGDYDAATKTLSAMAESRDPMSGEKVTYQETVRSVDPNTRLFTMSLPDGKGGYQKMLEIEYKRRAK